MQRDDAPVRLNLAGRMTDYFIDSKLTPVFIVFCLLVGLIGASLTPREENPQIIVPGAEVHFDLPGRSAEAVDRLVAGPAERALRELEGVDDTFATSLYGAARIDVQFDVGIDKEKAMVRVYQRIDALRVALPPDIPSPQIRRIDADDVPIVAVTLASAEYDDYALRRLADTLRERLNTLPTISVTELHGGRSREIRIDLDPIRLEAFGLSLDDGIARFADRNVAALIGDAVHQDRHHPVTLSARLTSVDAIRRMVLAVHDGQPIYVEDVATVHDGATEQRHTMARFAFGKSDPRYALGLGEMPAVTLSVAKKPNTNSVTTANEVLLAIEEMRAEFLPEAVHVITTRDDGAQANDTVNRLLRDMAVAISAVIVALLPFLGLRAGLIISGTLPLILFLTVAVDLVTGHTLNRIALFAMILSLGMIVDDSIVTLENIYRSYQQGGTRDARRAAVLAVNEIGPPTTMATVAVILVFASLNILSGMSGEYFAPISFNVMVTMALSLLLAYTVVPWSCHRWLRGRVAPAPDDPMSTPLYRRYAGLLMPLLERPMRRRLLYGAIVLALAGSLLQPAWQFLRPAGVGGPLSSGGVMLAIMPKENKNQFTITLDMPETTPLEVTDAAARRLGEVLRAEPVIANHVTYLGMPGVIDFAGQFRGLGHRRGPHVAEITVNLVHKSQRRTQLVPLIARLRDATLPLKAAFPGIEIGFLDAPPGPPSRATLVAELYGTDPEVLRRLSDTVKARFEQTWGVVDVSHSQPVDLPRFDITVDAEKAALAGVSARAIQHTLAALVGGQPVAEAHLPGERNPVPIVVKVPRALEIDPLTLDRVHLRNAQGASVPLSEVTRTRTVLHDRPILRKNNERVTYVTAEIGDTAPAYVILDMDAHLKGLDLGNGQTLKTGGLGLRADIPQTLNGYHLLWDGEIRLTLDSFGEMAVVLSAALTLIFLLLVAIYRSFSIALLAMVAVPLGLIGVFPGHWLVGINFSMGSAIGVLALAGVVIRNSLLIIDFIQDYQRQGRPLKEAVVLAGAVRFRPIFLSALTVALGTLILYTEPLFAGLATSLIFGTVISTGLTLLILPTLYYRLAVKHPDWFDQRSPAVAG